MGRIVSNSTFIPVIRDTKRLDEPQCFAEMFDCLIVPVSGVEVNDIVWLDEIDGGEEPQFAQLGAVIKLERGVEFVNFSGIDVDANEEAELIGLILETFKKTQVPTEGDPVVVKQYIGVPLSVKTELMK